MVEFKNTTQATAEQIERWKKEHGQIFEVECEGEYAYFRKPTRKELSYALTLQANGKNLEMLEQILTSCHIGGSGKFVKETDYMLGAAELVQSLIQVKHVEIKNL